MCRTQLNLAPLNWSSAAAGKVPVSNVDNMTLHTADEPERKYQNLELLCSNNIHHGKFSGNWSCPKFWLALAACKAVSEPRKSVKMWLKRENKRGLLKSSLAYLGILPAERFTKSHFFNLAHNSQGQISEDLKDLRGIWWIDYLSQLPWLGIKSQRTRHFYQDSRGA